MCLLHLFHKPCKVLESFLELLSVTCVYGKTHLHMVPHTACTRLYSSLCNDFFLFFFENQRPCQKAFEDRRSTPTDYKAFQSYHHLKENRQPLAESIVREYPIFDSFL